MRSNYRRLSFQRKGKYMVRPNFQRRLFTLLLVSVLGVSASYGAGNRHSSKLSIAKDESSGQVVVSWSGKGVLKQAEGTDGRFKRVKTRGNSYVVEPTEPQGLF